MLPPPDISISLVIPEFIAAANSSAYQRRLKAKASVQAQGYFAEVVEPSLRPRFSNLLQYLQVKPLRRLRKNRSANPKLQRVQLEVKTMLPSLRCLSVSKFDNMFDYSSFT